MDSLLLQKIRAIVRGLSERFADSPEERGEVAVDEFDPVGLIVIGLRFHVDACNQHLVVLFLDLYYASILQSDPVAQQKLIYHIDLDLAKIPGVVTGASC